MLEDPELFAAIEAMLYISGEPAAISDLARALEIAPFQLEEALDRMSEAMETQKRGLKLKRFGEHVTTPDDAAFACEAAAACSETVPVPVSTGNTCYRCIQTAGNQT